MRQVKLTENIRGQGVEHEASLVLNEVDRGEAGMGLRLEIDAPSPQDKGDLEPIMRLMYRALSMYMESFEPHSSDGECMCEDCLAEEFSMDLDDDFEDDDDFDLDDEDDG